MASESLQQNQVEFVALQNMLSHSVTAASISWNNINVFSKSSSGFGLFQNKTGDETHIIKNVSGSVAAGQTLAIMGSSGAGKTTLLNVLTARNLSQFEVDGMVKINGQIADVDMITSMSAYVQQDDMFIPTLTVREHLVFQAMVRMDQSISENFRIQRIAEVMKELSLEKCAETRVGGPGSFKGISGGEMKRLSFAVEILTNPSIMFCDEPTSGLDSFMAGNLVRIINKMAAAGRTIVCTIHQPSSEVFHLFQNLMLMADGRVAYLGPVTGVVSYFNKLGMQCPPNYNPADFLVQELAVVPGKEKQCKKKVHRICDYYDTIRPKEDLRRESSFAHPRMVHSRYKASTYQQYQALMWRSFLITIREPMLTYVRMGQAIIIATMLGLIYWQQKYDQRGTMNMNGSLFLVIVNLTIQNTFAVVNVFCSELPIFIREHNNGMYRVDPYYICRNLAELPIFVLIPIVVIGINYYMINYNPAVDAFLYMLIVGIIISFCGVSFGYMTSCLCKYTDIALSLGPPLIVPLQLLGGFFLNTKTIPSYLTWAKYISWFHYGFDLLIYNQWSNVLYLDCDLDPEPVTSSPADWLTTIITPGTRSENMCLPNGPAVISFLDLGHKPYWVDFFAIIFLGVTMRAVGFLALYIRAKNR